MQLIGVAGCAGAGKNTVADYLTEHYGYEQVSFASTLKSMLATMGFPEPSNRDLKEANIEGFDFSWRFLAQTLGTEWARVHLGKDIWVNLTLRNLKQNGKYVFSDIRFENERFAVSQAGGTTIHLRGRGVDLGSLASHPSEKPLMVGAYDFLVMNDSTPEHLFANVRGIAMGMEHRA